VACADYWGATAQMYQIDVRDPVDREVMSVVAMVAGVRTEPARLHRHHGVGDGRHDAACGAGRTDEAMSTDDHSGAGDQRSVGR
jgi:hypothetical protein